MGASFCCSFQAREIQRLVVVIWLVLPRFVLFSNSRMSFELIYFHTVVMTGQKRTTETDVSLDSSAYSNSLITEQSRFSNLLINMTCHHMTSTSNTSSTSIA